MPARIQVTGAAGHAYRCAACLCSQETCLPERLSWPFPLHASAHAIPSTHGLPDKLDLGHALPGAAVQELLKHGGENVQERMQVEKQQKKKNMLQGCINGQQEPEFGPDTEKTNQTKVKKEYNLLKTSNFGV